MLPVGTNPPQSVLSRALSLSSQAPQPQNPNTSSLHYAGSDGLMQSTEGSFLCYGRVISHNAAALGVGAGEDIGFPQSKLQDVLTARGGEEAEGAWPKSGTAVTQRAGGAERRGEAASPSRHQQWGVRRNPAFAHFRHTNPAVSAQFRFPFLLSEEAGRGGGVEGNSPAVRGSLEPCAHSVLIAHRGPYGAGAPLHPQTTAAAGRVQS